MTNNVYANMADEITERAMRRAEKDLEPCIGSDPMCPCQDGDACHYRDLPNSPAMPAPLSHRNGYALTHYRENAKTLEGYAEIAWQWYVFGVTGYVLASR